MGFLSSSIERLFFNKGVDINYPNLSTLLTETSYEKQTGHKIQVEIWNGCGVPNLALMYTDYLRHKGLDVLESKNVDNFNYLNTTVLHHRGDINRSTTVADILKLNSKYIIEDKNDHLFYDLTIIIGKDYIDLPSYKEAILFQPPF